MKKTSGRRNFMKTALAATVVVSFDHAKAGTDGRSTADSKLRISINAYSFNKQLMDKSMSLDDLLLFCAKYNIAGADLTAYYFPGYPQVPSDEYLYNLKRNAFRLGVDISGTGVRNDFTNADAGKRKEDIALIKNWIIAASKIGAPVLRIFTGNLNPAGFRREEIVDWMVPDLAECAAFGQKYGVIVAIQNHNDFLRTADQTIEIIKRVNSPWFGLILDIGSFRQGDPYDEIKKVIPYAVNWQIKELVYPDGKEQPVDLPRLIPLIEESAYRGYLPIETLGPGDPFAKVPIFLDAVRKAIS